MSSRKQLEGTGEILDGMIPPKWFKKKCDGCSVPTKIAKGSYLAKMLRAGCDMHDGEYTTIPIMWPAKSKRAKQERKLSDKRLRKNIRAIMGARGKHPVRGVMAGTMFYVALRPFGRWALTPWQKKKSRMPVTLEEFSEFIFMIEDWYGPITHHGNVQLDIIARSMGIEK